MFVTFQQVPIKVEIEGLESSSISEEVKLKAQKLRFAPCPFSETFFTLYA